MLPPMTLGLVLALGCALGWGAFDAWRKRLSESVPPLPLALWISLGHVPLFLAGRLVSGGQIDSAAYWAPGLGSVALNVLGNLGFLHAVRVSPLSLVVPLLSFVPVLTAVAAIPMLDEWPTAMQWAGMVGVVAGALVLNAGSGRERGLLAPLRALLREPGSLPMLGTAAAWALTLVLDKHALRHADPAAHGLVIVTGVSVALLLVLLVRRELDQLAALRSVRGTYAAALIIGAITMALQLMAIPRVMLALLEAIKRAVGLLSAVVLGRVLFGERITATKIVAVVMMGSGAALVLLGG